MPFPRSIDWAKKRDVVPYCHRCYEVLTNECETLAAVPKASAKRKATNNPNKKKVNTKKKPEENNTRKKKRKRNDSSTNKKVSLLVVCVCYFFHTGVFQHLHIIWNCPSYSSMLCHLPPKEKKQEGEYDNIKVGMRVKTNGSRWKLPETDIYYGKILSKRKYRGKWTVRVLWEEDNVIEYIPVKDVLPMIIRDD